MKMKLLYSTLLSTTLLFASCVKEDNTQQMERGPEATISLKVPTQVASVGSGEDEIRDVRIVSFVPSTAPNNEGRLDVNGGNISLIANPITQTLRTGVRDVYVFANETQVDGLTSELNAVQSLDDLASIQIPYRRTLAPPFFSYSVEPNFEIKKENNTSIDAKVVRTVSKVRLNIVYTWGPDTDLYEELVIRSVQVVNLPVYSYLIGKEYNGGQYQYTSSQKLEGDVLKNTSVVPNEYRSQTLIIYVPEFLGASEYDGKHAYILIYGYIPDHPSVWISYEIPLGDGIGSTPMTDYNITRNTDFKIQATIKSYGPDNLIIKTDVQDWDMVESPSDVGEYFEFFKALHEDGTPLTDYGNIVTAGEKIKIYCKASSKGWTAYLYDRDGFKLSEQVVQGPGCGELFVEFTIPPLDSSLDYDEYTVQIPHPTLASKSIKLNFVQADGMILAADGFGSGVGKYGLQVAKKGNLLPRADNVAAEYDLSKPWSTENVFIDAKHSEYGGGKTNMDIIMSLDIEKYPAFNECRKLGVGWYLPSLSEFTLFVTKQSLLSDPFKIPSKGNYTYWTSTETDFENAITMPKDYTNRQVVYYEPKRMQYSLRCVRYL